MNELEWLENWYQQNCNGYWEHFYGIEIGTLDNPGWYIHIDLKETPYENLKMEEQKKEQGDNDWIRCIIEDKTFKGVGDSQKFREILRVFQNLIEDNPLEKLEKQKD